MLAYRFDSFSRVFSNNKKDRAKMGVLDNTDHRLGVARHLELTDHPGYRGWNFLPVGGLAFFLCDGGGLSGPVIY